MFFLLQAKVSYGFISRFEVATLFFGKRTETDFFGLKLIQLILFWINLCDKYMVTVTTGKNRRK